MIHPLVVNAQVALHAAQMSHGVLGENGQAVACDELGDGVVDFSVVVVRTARQDDAVAARLLEPGQDLLALGAHSGLEALVHTPSDLDGVVNLLARGEQALRYVHTARRKLLATLDAQLLVKAQLEGLFVVVGQKRVEEVYVAGA